MKKLLLCLLSTLIVAPIIACDPVEEAKANDPVEKAKAKWMKAASDNVEQERLKVLKKYNIPENKLTTEQLHETLRSMSHALSKSSQMQHILNSSVQNTSDPFFSLAKEILTGQECIYVRMIYDKSKSIGVTKDPGSKTCIVNFDQDFFKGSEKNILVDLLYHEKGHVVYDDTVNQAALMEIIAKHLVETNKTKLDKNNRVSSSITNEIEQELIAYGKAQETRADVYGVITSPEQGQGAVAAFKQIDLLRKRIANVVACMPGLNVLSKLVDIRPMLGRYLLLQSPHHPDEKDRLMIIKQIQSDLENAEQEKQYAMQVAIQEKHYKDTAMQAMSNDQLI